MNLFFAWFFVFIIVGGVFSQTEQEQEQQAIMETFRGAFFVSPNEWTSTNSMDRCNLPKWTYYGATFFRNGQIVHPWENYWEVSTNEFSLTIVRKPVDHSIQKEGMVYFGENCLDGYFNIKVGDKNITSPTHSLLGQTAHHSHTTLVDNKDKEGKGEIEGNYKDYTVGGPFENVFKHN